MKASERTILEKLSDKICLEEELYQPLSEIFEKLRITGKH